VLPGSSAAIRPSILNCRDSGGIHPQQEVEFQESAAIHAVALIPIKRGTNWNWRGLSKVMVQFSLLGLI